MRLSPSLNDALNEQITHEITNSLKYKILASYYEDLRLSNIAKKFKGQAEEEFGHFTKIINYLNDRLGGKYIPVEITTPQIQFNSPQETAQFYLDTELGTTESLESIYELIQDEKSYIDVPFILEMLSIQVTEEIEADEFKSKLAQVHDLVLFDASLGE